MAARIIGESGSESSDDSDNEQPPPKRTRHHDVEPGTPLDFSDNVSTSTVLEDQPDQTHDHDESHNESHNMKLTDFLPADIPAQTLQVAVDLSKVLEDYFNRTLEKCHLTENITVSELDLTLPSAYESKLQDNIDQLATFLAKIIENICKSKLKLGRVVFPEMRIDLLEGVVRGLENKLSEKEGQFNEIKLPFSAKDMKTLNDDIVGVVELLFMYKPKEICLQTDDLSADQRHTALSKKLKDIIQKKITEDDKKPKVKLGSKLLVNWKQSKLQDKAEQQKLTKQSTSKKQSSKQKQRGSVSEASGKAKILLPKKLKLQDQSQIFAFDFQLMVPLSPDSPDFITAYEYWSLEKIHNKFQSTGKGITVAIVDTGISSHHAFAGKNITTMNFSGDLINTDKVGHGTICAGILCGNSFQCYRDPKNPLDKRITNFPPGVAPDANLVVCKVTSGDLKTAKSSAIANALQWIGNNNEVEENQRIDVVSLSMGSRGISFEVVDAINRLVYKGVIVVCAASNYGHQFSQPICYPAHLGNVLCIGSHGHHGKPSSFSPVGQEIDFLGPGEKIAAPNSSISANHVAVDSGTSYAAPAVAGLVCLILEYINLIGAKFDPAVAKQFKNHWVMKEILRKMSTCPGRHTDDEGFGALNPLQFFQRPVQTIEMIEDEVINPDFIYHS